MSIPRAEYLPGDIFLVDSTASYARVVKFLMQAPTVYQWLWRKIRGTQQKVRYYHAGMVYSSTHVIEQQKVVEFETIDAAFLNDPHIVYRNLQLTDQQRYKLVGLARNELGEGYDVLLIFGKTLTWLTGLGFLTRLTQWVDKEICVTRVAKWYQKVTGETFGKGSWHEVTTDNIDDWCTKKRWMIVSIRATTSS